VGEKKRLDYRTLAFKKTTQDCRKGRETLEPPWNSEQRKNVRENLRKESPIYTFYVKKGNTR